MDIQRRENEKFFDYCKRLVLNKQVYDLDNAEVWKLLFNEDISSDEARKRLRGLYKLFEKIDVFNELNIEDVNLLQKIEQEKLELQKEKIRFQDQRKEYMALIRKEARLEHLIECFKNEKIDEFKINIYYNPASNKQKIALLVLADWHTSLKCDNYWNIYNLDIFYKRINELTNRAITYCRFHNVDKLVILGLGDLINGLIHVSTRVTSEENIIRQLKIVANVLSEMIIKFAENFNQIDFYSVLGNHGRVTSQKDASIEEENFEILIPWYLKVKFEKVNNVNIYENEYDEGIIVFDIFDKKYFAVHGDYDKIDTAIENLSLMIREFPEAIFMAHNHHLECDERHGIKVYTCSSLSGTDTYSKNLRKTSKPGQELFIFDEEIGLECHYPIKFL